MPPPSSNLRHNQLQHHTQRSHVSIIRTRSQQPHPLAPVNMYASPLKEAMKNHSQKDNLESQQEAHTFVDVPEGISAEGEKDNISVAVPTPLRRKRTYSPSPVREGNGDKRFKVFGKSSKANSPVSQQSDVSHASALKIAELVGTPSRTITSHNAFQNGTPTVDFSKIPGSPLKPSCSPSKVFQFTIGGSTRTVPITPSRQAMSKLNMSTMTQANLGICSKLLPAYKPHTTAFNSHQDALSLISPPAVSSHQLTQPPFHTPGTCSQSVIHHAGKTITSPLKSRIPVPITRISRPFTLPDGPILHETPSNGLGKPVLKHISPARVKLRAKGKAKSGVQGKVRLTRQAVRRGLRRISSVKDLQAKTVPSTKPPLLQTKLTEGLTKSSRPFVTKKKTIFTTNSPLVSNGSQLILVQDSPNKPTPLAALSTALQKLETTAPSAPASRPRPSTSLGFSSPCRSPSAAAAALSPKVTQQTQESLFATQSQTSLDNNLVPSSKPAHKPSLPSRRPTTVDLAVRTAGNGVGPFASKQTSLSTVPASPAKSIIGATHAPPFTPSKHEGPSTKKCVVFDVDAWESQGDHKRRVDHEIVSTKSEYYAPLHMESTQLALPPPQISPSRRASQASLSLTQSLAMPRLPGVPVPGRTVSLSHLNLNPRTPVKTRGRTKPAPVPADNADITDANAGKRMNAKMPGSLDVLKDCIIFVDIRTEDGEDSSALFVDMLRGLGARMLAKPGKSCTHLIFKAGLPSTVTKYKLLPEPQPLVVSIAWVVECAEKRQHIDETRFLVNIDELGEAGGVNRRRSLLPKPMRTVTLGQLESGEYADVSIRADSSFTSEEPSNLVLSQLSPLPSRPLNDLPPLERARIRNRGLRLSKE